MSITLHHLHVLSCVAQEQSVTKAAHGLGLTQPAVSSILKQLQSHFSVPLFDIWKRKIKLTKAGEILLSANQDIEERLNAALHEIQAIEGCIRGDLTVAMVSSAKFFMPQLVGKFLTAHPKVRVHLDIQHRAQVVEALEEHRCDFAILSALTPPKSLDAYSFKDNPLVIVASPKHPLANRSCLTWDEIKHERWLVREPSSGLRSTLEDMFNRSQVRSPDIVMELASTGGLTQAASANLGIALVPRISIDLELANKQLVILPVEGFPLLHTWYAVTPKSKKLIPAADKFIQVLSHHQL